jgi:hypothetical protein
MLDHFLASAIQLQINDDAPLIPVDPNVAGIYFFHFENSASARFFNSSGFTSSLCVEIDQ